MKSFHFSTTKLQRRMAWVAIAALLLGALFFPALARAQAYYPSFTVTQVSAGESITIQAINLPMNTDFAFRMGPMGTQGVYGEFIGVANSGDGGTQSFTVTIPEELKGLSQIAVRMDNFYFGYAYYSWFHNNSTPDVTPAPVVTPAPSEPDVPIYTGYPTFNITSVARNESVTVQTYNLPPNTDFTVRMNYFGTQGLNGTTVATFNSGEGGMQSLSFSVPAAYANQARISIRMDSYATGLYAFNWFYNYNAN